MKAKPTDAELQILNVLWTRGPSTVREVKEVLSASRPTGYTTVLKLLQIMYEKRLVSRDESRRAHVYAFKVSRDDTQRGLIHELVEKGFGGSAQDLVLRTLESQPASKSELREIRQLLERVAGRGRK